VFALANALTLVRIPLAALLWLRVRDASWVLFIVAVAALTDVLDGRVARVLRRRWSADDAAHAEAVGAWLDPLCDKIFALSTLGALWFGFGAPVGVILLAVAREILIAPLVVLYHLISGLRQTLRFDFHADWLGKLTTALQFAVAVALIVFPAAALFLAMAAAALGTWAALHYVRRGIRSARATADRGHS
jgi:cardiolipin synthase (CMP-forming)